METNGSISVTVTPTVTSEGRKVHSSLTRRIERNFDFLQQQLVCLIEGRKGSQSPFVATLCIAVVFIYSINLMTISINDDGNNRIERSPVVEIFTITPGNILSSRMWFWSGISILTYPLVELHWWQVLNDIIAIYLSATLIEPLWGSRELISFFLIVNLSVAFLTVAHYIILFSIYSDDDYLYSIRVYGLSGYCAAICVSVKQLLSDSVLISTGLGKFKNSNVPLIALLLSYLFYLVNLIEGSLVLMFFYGLLVSWFYLRFIQTHTNGNRGDFSEGFAFATFFPNIIRPFVAVICNTIYSFLVYIKICSPSTRQYQSFKVLCERLTQEHTVTPVRGQFKHHASGDYEHLHQPMSV